MKIDRIELYNIGPYEGLNVFDISGQRKKGKITVIGGKNGAGKTTLFSSIKVCFYGYREGGYQSVNGYYKRSIKKLVNDKAKLDSDSNAYIQLDIEIFNGQDWDAYSLKRSWKLNLEKFESYTVVKNGRALTDDEINDFENYLLNLIPPELFELYFFDGEQIADFFLKDENGDRIKRAFMTICGYDTFDIMYKNFKRIGKNTKDNNESINIFLNARDNLNTISERLNALKQELIDVEDKIDSCDSELTLIEEEYKFKGGVSNEKWNENLVNLKTEERFRDEKNAWLKSAANDIIPYIILHDEISQLLEKMDEEREIERKKVLLDALESIIPDMLLEISKSTPGFSKTTAQTVEEKIKESLMGYTTSNDNILNLSKEEYELLLHQTNILLSYEKDSIISARKDIKKSIKRSQTNREKIESSNISEIDSFIKKKEELLKEKQEAIELRGKLLEKQKTLVLEESKAQNAYKSAEKTLEKDLKDKSINDLTTRSIRFLDVLQNRLFKSEIVKVESLFMQKMEQLMRKEKFINKIIIDEDFTIHVFKNINQKFSSICERLNDLKPEGYMDAYGKIHCDELLKKCKCKNLEQFYVKYRNDSGTVETIHEFDKTIMSKGEKQVFIMALYWSIMQLCNKEIPFVIDTPFARIDTTHRAHITKYFFRELKGQVIIFSTDEEITDEHIKVMGRDLQSKFMIENLDNSRTYIVPGKYFGEAL